MADNLETPSFGSFSIENTLEMGAGSSELLNDLLAPETSTSSPDDISTIIKEVDETPPVTKKVTTTTEETTKEPEKEKSIEDFLYKETEEETPPVETTEETKPDPDDDAAPETSSKFQALANDLLNLGVFSKEEGEDDITISSPEEFLERFQSEKKKGAIEVVNNFIGQFGEDYQQAFQAIYVKGVDPKQYFTTYNNIASFSEMDLTKEDNQVKVIKQALSDQGFEPDDIETEVERLRNYGDLDTVAARHHKVLVKKEATKLQELEQKAEQELQQKALIRNQYISNVQAVLEDKIKAKDFDGIPINPKLANEVQEFLLVDKYKTASGETLTDFDKTILELKRPENHAMKVKVALLLKMLEKDPTLSTIQKAGVTKKSNQLFNEVARQVEKSPAKSNRPDTSKSWFS